MARSIESVLGAAEGGAGTQMSRNAYRRWAEARPRGRCEHIDGRVVAMAPELASHADRKALIWLALRRSIAAAGLPCHVYPEGMMVQVGEDGDHEPGAVPHCADPLPGNAVAVAEPLVVVDVLSASTRAEDLTRKLVGYFTVPSIRHHLVLFADRPQVIHHRRHDDGPGLDTRMFAAGGIRLDPPGITITVEEIYPP